jgi:hypothetical protein
MQALYQIADGERPCIQTRQAEAHELAEHLLLHPFWRSSVRPILSASDFIGDELPPRDGIAESADKVYLPPGLSPQLLVGLQSIIDGWVASRNNE